MLSLTYLDAVKVMNTFYHQQLHYTHQPKCNLAHGTMILPGTLFNMLWWKMIFAE